MLRFITTISSFFLASKAILVTPGSQCSPSCGNVLDSTSVDDLVCTQGAFKSNPTGQLFAGCVDCQRSSTFHSGNDSDIQSMLYNVRFALSYCLWGAVPERNPNAIDTPCITSKACAVFKTAVEFKNLSTEYDAFQYCDQWPINDTSDFSGCTDCLQAEDREFLANFVIALQAGCEQRPSAGLYIGLDGEIFSNTTIKITAPSPTATVNPEWFDQGPLTLGVKVGIAIGALVVLLAISGCGVVLNGKRKRRAFLRKIDAKVVQHGGWTPQSRQVMGQVSVPSRALDDTPISQRALCGWNDTPVSTQPSRSWDDSPVTANGETLAPRYPSPYSSQFTSPVSATEGPAVRWPAAVVVAQNRQAGSHIDPHTPVSSWSPSSDGNGKDDERFETYEMHEVDTSECGSAQCQPQMQTPVLNHPGHGRPDSNAAVNERLSQHGDRDINTRL